MTDLAIGNNLQNDNGNNQPADLQLLDRWKNYLPPIGGANVRLSDLLIADIWRYQIFSY
jgi:hypothetical protein